MYVQQIFFKVILITFGTDVVQIARYTLHTSSQLSLRRLLMKSPTKLYCISHTPEIADVRILKLNFAEKDHNCKPSLASSSHVDGKQKERSVNNKTFKLSVCN